MKALPSHFNITTVFLGLLFSMPLLAQAPIPTPEELFGFTVGDDFKLADYEQSIEYFKQLDAASENLELVYVGRTSEGKPWYMALISSKENLANIAKYKEIAGKLAHPAGLTREEALALSKEGKPLVHIDGGLHASEVAGAQHTISLAHYLLSNTDDDRVSRILDDVILMLWPSLNPDGQDIVVNWYRTNVGTPYEISPVPQLYQKYVGHDNNRDAYMLNMIESRVVERVWRDWEPNIIHVHHQTSPFPTRIWLPPFAEPLAPQTPPLVARMVNTIGMAMAQELETQGMKGAVHMGKGFDAWYPGYIDYMPVLQNTPAFWTETALYRYATPYFYTMRDFPESRSDLRNESLYSSPWEGGWWRLADAVQYMEVASIAVLDYASKYSETVLFNKYQAAQTQIEKYTKQPPYAYFIPQKQHDPVRPVELLKRLAFNGIHVSQLTEDIAYEGVDYPKGTWVIPMNQEFGELARQLLDVQEYPDLREFPDGPLEQPYDAAGWTLPLQMEVDVIAAMAPISDEIRAVFEEVKGIPLDWDQEPSEDLVKADFAPGFGFDTDETAAGIKPLPGSVSGRGAVITVNPKENNAFRVIAKALGAGLTVKYQANGTYAIEGAGSSQITKWVEEYAVNITRMGSADGVKTAPRIGVYRPWTASMDMGWTRWLLDMFGFGYTSLRNADIKAGKLNERFDVIVIASEWTGSIENGHQKGSVPPGYEGGLGLDGIQNLDSFVKQGGTFLCLNQCSDFAIEKLHLPVENVVKGLSRQDFFTGGSIMQVVVNTVHPVMAGMPELANIFVFRSPVFNPLEGFEGSVLANYQESGSPLRSGYLVGEEYINGFAAALDVKHGDGNVILYGFRPQWRGQSMGTYRTLFNGLLYADGVSRTK